MNRKALVTIAIGEKYVREWEKYVRPTWEKYAARHGYDIIPIFEPIRPEFMSAARPAHWQKCFVLGHEKVRRYEEVVWVDTDILINYHRAPCVAAANNSEKIGAVPLQKDNLRFFENTDQRFIPFKSYSWNAYHFPDDIPQHLMQFRTHKKNIKMAEQRSIVNTGVLVMKPALHRDFLESIFFKYQDAAKTEDYEQGPLSDELHAQQMVNYLDRGFNVIFYEELVHHYPFLWHRHFLMQQELQEALLSLCLTTSFLNSYFLHFPGGDKELFMKLTEVDTPDEFSMSVPEVLRQTASGQRTLRSAG